MVSYYGGVSELDGKSEEKTGGACVGISTKLAFYR